MAKMFYEIYGCSSTETLTLRLNQAKKLLSDLKEFQNAYESSLLGEDIDIEYQDGSCFDRKDDLSLAKDPFNQQLWQAREALETFVGKAHFFLQD